MNPVSLNALQLLNEAAAKYGTLTTKPLYNPANNYTTNLPFTKTTDSFDIKADFSLNDKNHLSGRFSWQRAVTYQDAAFGAFLGGPQVADSREQGPDCLQHRRQLRPCLLAELLY